MKGTSASVSIIPLRVSEKNAEPNFSHRMITKSVIKTIDFAVFTILTDAGQDFTLSVSHLPTWCFQMKISTTFLVYVYWTVHYLPTWVFVPPEVFHHPKALLTQLFNLTLPYSASALLDMRPNRSVIGIRSEEGDPSPLRGQISRPTTLLCPVVMHF